MGCFIIGACRQCFLQKLKKIVNRFHPPTKLIVAGPSFHRQLSLIMFETIISNYFSYNYLRLCFIQLSSIMFYSDRLNTIIFDYVLDNDLRLCFRQLSSIMFYSIIFNYVLDNYLQLCLRQLFPIMF